MQVLAILGNKFVLYALIALMGIGMFQIHRCSTNDADARVATYKRQLAGQLSEKEKELQAIQKELGVAQSELVTQSELTDRLKKDREELDKNFDKFVTKHNLMIKSRDRTIASLKQQVLGGTTTVVVSPNEEGCEGIEKKRNPDISLCHGFRQKRA